MAGVVPNVAALRLYRQILRLHRQKLPHHLREMGDSYVKKEFRDHKSAKPNFVKEFMREWEGYATTLSGQNANYGLDLTEDVIANMSDEQKASLERLRQEATNFRQE